MKIRVGNKKRGDIGEYVGRPSPLGNPYPLVSESKRDECIEKYRTWLHQQIEGENEEVLKELCRLHSMYEMNGELCLLCWCYPKRCHADIIREILEQM